jgi:hypothetical protein
MVVRHSACPCRPREFAAVRPQFAIDHEGVEHALALALLESKQAGRLRERQAQTGHFLILRQDPRMDGPVDFDSPYRRRGTER